MRTSLREGSGMVSRRSVGLLPALKGRQKKRAGWGTIVWLDLRIAVPEVGEGKGQVKGASLRLNNHAGVPLGLPAECQVLKITSSDSGKLLYPTKGSYWIALSEWGAK